MADLRGLLETAGLKPPYVLVGHSLGGLYMQYFARQYPSEVAGLVLVDSTHWDQQARMEKAFRTIATMTQVLVRSMPPHVQREFSGSELAGRQVREAPPPKDIPVVVLTGTQRNLFERGKFTDVDSPCRRKSSAPTTPDRSSRIAVVTTSKKINRIWSWQPSPMSSHRCERTIVVSRRIDPGPIICTRSRQPQ